MSQLEDAVLSEVVFCPDPGSPARSASSSSPSLDTDDELGSDVSRSSTPFTDPSTIHKSSRTSTGGMAGGGWERVEEQAREREGVAQTGPKGVIADRNSKARETRVASELARREFTKYQESRGITAMTVHEEDQAQKAEQGAKEAGRAGRGQGHWDGEKEEETGDEDGDDEVRKWRSFRRRELLKEHYLEQGGGDLFSSDVGAGVKRGGLREVGMEGFLSAVETSGWVAVLIYEPDLARCEALLASMLALAFSLSPSSNLTLLRARATSLQFSLLKDTDPDHGPRPDLDVLPTLLAYKDGELEHTWVRVDWEVREDGVEGLLKKEGILPSRVDITLNRLRLDEDQDDE